MGDNPTIRRNAVRHSQNVLLYGGVSFSAAGSLAAAILLVSTFGSIADPTYSYLWMALVLVLNFARVLDSHLFHQARDAEDNTTYWKNRFYWSTLCSSLTWAASIWLLFPANDPSHQVLLVVAICAVAYGSLASLPYDNKLNLLFNGILFVSVVTKLVIVGTAGSYELALFNVFFFFFLIGCSAKFGDNYIELLRLKHDSQETNRALTITTEKMAQMGYWQWEIDSPAMELSENLRKLLGFESYKVEYTEFLERVHPDDKNIISSSVDSALKGSEQFETAIEYRLAEKTNTGFRHIRQLIKRMDEVNGEACLFGSVQDITDIKAAEQKIYDMAYYDSLTGLANRAHFHEHLEKLTKRSEETNQQFSILYIDLDNFKSINDSYGHECGDKYLSLFGNYLRSVVSYTDFIARLGGDEFCVILHDLSDREEAKKIAKRCLGFGKKAIEIGNHRIHPKLSIGISVFPDDGVKPGSLVKSADMAMYHVKQNGKQNLAFYTESMRSDSDERERLEADLRKALANNNFELWYQPKMDIRDNSIAGVEALIRWRHPEKGLIPPDLFITTAERVGVIKDIGKWVLKAACIQLKDWNLQGFNLQMAVNVSGDHFASNGFTQSVQEAIQTYAINPEDLEIEITESLSRDPVVHSRICKELRHAGVCVAIDDFGTGYSSLSVLGDLEVDTLKIDRSFIQYLPQDKSSKLMVKAITDLALGLGFDIVAEGVETKQQLEFLKELNIPYVQGYYFSKPLIEKEMLKLLTDERNAQKAA